MFNEVDRLKAGYAKKIEDGRKVEVFSSMPEWQWYVEHVIKPTVQDYTDRIMSGSIPDDKEDWVLRGMVMGMKLIIDTTETFVQSGRDAKEKSKRLYEEEEHER